jgi:NCAIR mutase (PurE)-related protein
VPEIILAEGKNIEDLLEICLRAIENTDRIIVSRADRQVMDKFTGVLLK